MLVASSEHGRLLNHDGINRDDAVEMMVDYLGDLGDAMYELESIRGDHDKFQFLEIMYTQQLQAVEQSAGDDDQVMQYRAYALWAYLLYLVGTFIFMDNMATYTNVVYLKYSSNLERIHEYKWGDVCLV